MTEIWEINGDILYHRLNTTSTKLFKLASAQMCVNHQRSEHIAMIY